MSACHKENADTNKPCAEVHLPREVIQNQLLARLNEDKSVVAVLLNEEDLTLIIKLIGETPMHAQGMYRGTPSHKKAVALLQDLQQLRKGAFGK